MKKITMGILAHVDAGKTTLSEALLYISGAIRTLGRVDHKNAFLDTDAQEKNRGITIFSKQAELELNDGKIMLLDTPGHVDFSAEMERTLQVLDYAVLVISGKEGIQGHTVTLWKLLKKHSLPVFIFINKMDLEGSDRQTIMSDLKKRLDPGCADFTDGRSADADALSFHSEELMEELLEKGEVSSRTLTRAIAERKVFPCRFGSALKLEGVEDFLKDFWDLTSDIYGEKEARAALGTRIYKISRDPKGNRLTHLKVTSGTLRVKDLLGDEKAEQIRIYSGEKFRTCDAAAAGSICAVAGPVKTFAGQGTGTETGTVAPAIEPVMIHRLILPEGEDPFTVYSRLKQLDEEDPQLRIVWDEGLRVIQLQLMGQVQLEVLKNIIKERFGFDVSFGQGRISYRETLAGAVIGGGHFEPLRHYAEVHLLMEPGQPGSGITVDSSCSTDILDLNWQRLITTHIYEKEHTGVLAGFPVTDIKFTIIAGRAHLKHTEGGDFRQATYRAIRQGLMKARQKNLCRLLEPWYDFRLELPGEHVGRAMADIQRMGGSFETPMVSEEGAVLEGRVPASELKDYAAVLNSYTRGFGRLFYSMRGYEACHDTEAVLAESIYDPEADFVNTGDSVFCGHGSGYSVPWYEADSYFHIGVSLSDEAGPGKGRQPLSEEDRLRMSEMDAMWEEHDLDRAAAAREAEAGRRAGMREADRLSGGSREDEELRRIFEKTYGAGSSQGNRHAAAPSSRIIESSPKAYRPTKPLVVLPEYIFVDGYNVIFAWEDLKELAKVNIDSAREALIEKLINYRGYRKCRMTVVFDAYKIKGGSRHTENRGGLEIVFTKEDETADTYIERTTYEMEKKWHLRVVSSDRLEQQMVLAAGGFRVSAADFRLEMEAVEEEIRKTISDQEAKVKKESRQSVSLKVRKNQRSADQE